MLITFCLHLFLCELVRHSLKGGLGMEAKVSGYYRILFQDCDRSAKKIPWREIANFTKRELEVLTQFCSLLSVSLLSGGTVLTKKVVKGIAWTSTLEERGQVGGGRGGEGGGEVIF